MRRTSGSVTPRFPEISRDAVVETAPGAGTAKRTEHVRCYKPAWTIDDSLREIASQRGKHFDPDLTDLFLNLVPDMMKTHGDIESYLSASGRDNPFIRDRAAINRELRGDGGLFDGRL